MEEELLWSQSTDERRFNESTRLCTVVILLVVRQRAVRETVGNALTINILLSYTRNHLGYVNFVTLTAAPHHGKQTIFIGERLLADSTCLCCRLVQSTEDLAFKLILIRLTCVIIKEIEVHLEQEFLNRLLVLLNHLVHLNTGRLIGYQITDAYTETIVDEELLNCVLEGIEHVYSRLRTIVIVSDVDNTLARLGEDVLVQLPLLEDALLDINLDITLVLHGQIDRREQSAHNLMT